MPTIDRAYAGEEGSDAAFIPGTDGRECGVCVSSGVACSCANDPKAQWWAQGGTRTFSGNIVIPTPEGRMFKKLDDPKDFLQGGNPSLPGHYQTCWEMMSELNHRDDSKGNFLKEMKARDISTYLVDYRGHQMVSGEKDETSMYPFHENLVSFSPYKRSPAPKVRADDIIEATVAKDMSVCGFHIKKGTALHLYVVSLSSAGVVTGIMQTNKNKWWVYFPIHQARKLVVRGKNWNE